LALDCCSKSENGRLSPPPFQEKLRPGVETASADEPRLRFPIRKDQFCFKHIRDLCGQAQITTGMLSAPDRTMDLKFPSNRASFPGETGCASSSRCQGTNRTARNRTSVRSALRPLLL